jgi:trehalose transport system permease protein
MARLSRFPRAHGFEIVLLLPLLLYIAAFTYVPVLQLIGLSFDANGRALGFEFGLANYAQLFRHFQFVDALLNTLFITFAGLALELTVGLFIAIQLNRRFPLRGAFRALYLLPLGVPTIVAAANMRYIFDSNGWLNQTLLSLGVIGTPVDWGGGGILTLLTVVVADMWKVTPMVMLILLAGLESIPEELYEAAKIDGAHAWQRFRHVTLPLLKPAITMALVIRGIDCFRIFEIPLVLAGKSGPVLSTFAWTEYSEALNPYTSAADSVILLLLILVCIAGYLRLAGGAATARREAA